MGMKSTPRVARIMKKKSRKMVKRKQTNRDRRGGDKVQKEIFSVDNASTPDYPRKEKIQYVGLMW